MHPEEGPMWITGYKNRPKPTPFFYLIDRLCTRPRMFLLNGTFEAGCAWIMGYLSGLHRAEPRLASEWNGFERWLEVKLDHPPSVVGLSVLRQMYPEDKKAFEQLNQLYQEFKSELRNIDPDGIAEPETFDKPFETTEITRIVVEIERLLERVHADEYSSRLRNGAIRWLNEKPDEVPAFLLSRFRSILDFWWGDNSFVDLVICQENGHISDDYDGDNRLYGVLMISLINELESQGVTLDGDFPALRAKLIRLH